MAKTPKQLDKSKIIEAISNLSLQDILDVNYQTVRLIELREKEEKEKLETASANLRLIQNGGKKE